MNFHNLFCEFLGIMLAAEKEKKKKVLAHSVRTNIKSVEDHLIHTISQILFIAVKLGKASLNLAGKMTFNRR